MNPANTNDLCANKLQKAAFALLLTQCCASAPAQPFQRSSCTHWR